MKEKKPVPPRQPPRSLLAYFSDIEFESGEQSPTLCTREGRVKMASPEEMAQLSAVNQLRCEPLRRTDNTAGKSGSVGPRYR